MTEILTSVMENAVLRDVTPCRLVVKYQHFGRNVRLHPLDRRNYSTLKTEAVGSCEISVHFQGVTSQNAVIAKE
jgi:hypothetical protein